MHNYKPASGECLFSGSFWHVYVSEVKKHWNSRSYSGKIIKIIPVREGKKNGNLNTETTGHFLFG